MNSQDPTGLWKDVLDRLRPDIGEANVNLWLKPVQAAQLDRGKLLLRVPNDFFVQWISKNYQNKVEAALKALAGSDVALEFSVSRTTPTAAPQAPASPAAPIPQEFAFSDLNPRYTFDTFVVGPHNRYAHAMSEFVSKNPGQKNPLFIYGPVGLGKTHLMQAIGHALRKEHPRTRVLYTTAEHFVNEYINSLRDGKNPDDFRGKYRYLDCLLIDDIQFLIAKEASEQEFFHTFNALFQYRKQIVISSDRAPKEMTPYEQRLVSRFGAGVVVDIKAPDLETRIAILRKKAEADKFFVPDDVINFIASSIKSNIRELEGSLSTVSAIAQTAGVQLTVDAARDILKISPEAALPVRMETIQKLVAHKYSVDIRDLKSKSRTDEIAFPRQVAMYLACTITDMSTKNIGAAFARDHSTVIHARDKIKELLAGDPVFSESMNKMIEQIRAVDNV